MRVKILKSMGGHNFSYGAGQEVDIPDDQAMTWIKAGLAVPLETESAALEPPENTMRKPPKRRKAGR